jgi:hypothetical protein
LPQQAPPHWQSVHVPSQAHPLQDSSAQPHTSHLQSSPQQQPAAVAFAGPAPLAARPKTPVTPSANSDLKKVSRNIGNSFEAMPRI